MMTSRCSVLCVTILALVLSVSVASELPEKWWLITEDDPFASLLAELGDDLPARLRPTASSSASSESGFVGGGGGSGAFGRPSVKAQAGSARAVAGPDGAFASAAAPPRRPSASHQDGFLVSTDRSDPDHFRRRPAGAAGRPLTTQRPFTTTRRPRPAATPPRRRFQPTQRPPAAFPAPPRPAGFLPPPPARRPNPFDPVNSSGARPTGPVVFPTEHPSTAQIISSRVSGGKCTCVPVGACSNLVIDTLGSCGVGQVCCSDPYQPKCGRIIPKSARAENAVRSSEAPWAAALIEADGQGFIFVCSGALIHPQVVVTAARCVEKVNERRDALRVRLGEQDLLTDEEPLGHVEIEIDHIEVHPDYEPADKPNDIALLFLREQAQLRPGLDTLCVRRSPARENRGCVIQSFGLQTPGANLIDLKLREATQVPISSDTCQRTIHRHHNQEFQVVPSHLCTRSDEACDSSDDRAGSPLVCPDFSVGEHRLRGLESWTVGCAIENMPGVYTDASVFYDWMDHRVTNYFGRIESYFGNQV